MTRRLHFHFSLFCTGEGSGNPLQCSCLENPRDGGAWWAAQSWTQLKWLSSSSSSSRQMLKINYRKLSKQNTVIQQMNNMRQSKSYCNKVMTLCHKDTTSQINRKENKSPQCKLNWFQEVIQWNVLSFLDSVT